MELIQTIEQFAWIGWLVLILIFLVIEMLTLDFTFLMLSIGGVAGLGVGPPRRPDLAAGDHRRGGRGRARAGPASAAAAATPPR